MDHIKVILNNEYIRECASGSYGAPIVLVPSHRLEEMTDIEDFI